MQKIRLILFITIALTLAALPAFASTIYVSPGDSIQAGIDSAGNGDTIIIKAGTYNETIVIDNFNKLTIKGAGQGQTIIDGTSISSPVVSILYSYNIKFMNITVTGAFSSDLKMDHVWNCVISKCDFINADGQGIYSSYAWDVSLQKCYIANNGSYGVYFYQSRNLVIKTCSIVGNGPVGLLLDQTLYVSLSRNNISDNTYGLYSYNTQALVAQQNTISENSSNGVYEDNIGGYNVYTKNNIINNLNSGVYVHINGFPLLIKNNISGNSGEGIFCYHYNAYPTLIQNTISGNTARGVYLYYTSGYLAKNSIFGNGFTGLAVYPNPSSVNHILTVLGNRFLSNSNTGVYYDDFASSASYPGIVQVSKNILAGNGADGLYIPYAQSAYVDRNSIYDNSGCGICLDAPLFATTVTKNFISSNGWNGLFGANGSVIGMNRILYNGWAGSSSGMYGFQYSYVYKNTVMYNALNGIDASYGDQSLVEKNKAFYNANYDIYNGSGNNVIVNNKYGTSDF